MDKISLFARHSFASCVSKGYAFLAKQLPLVSRVMLPYYTVAAFFNAIFLAYNIKVNVEVEVNGIASLGKVVTDMALYTVAWATLVVALSRMFLLFRRLTAMEMAQNGDLVQAKKDGGHGRTFKRTLQLAVRSLPYTIWILIFNMPGFPVIQPLLDKMKGLSLEYQGLIVLGIIVLMMIVAVFATPLVYTFYCRMMKPSGMIDEKNVSVEQFAFRKAYKKAFHSKVKILSLTLWGGFLWGLTCVVLLLPGVVATEAYLSNVEETVNYGAYDLIPTWGYVLIIFVGTLALTFCAIMSVAYYASLMYLFGDVYTKEEVKKIKDNSK